MPNIYSGTALHSTGIEEEGKAVKENSREFSWKMSISGDLRVSATVASYHKHPFRSSFPSSTSTSNSKVEFSGLLNRRLSAFQNTYKWPAITLAGRKVNCHSSRLSGITGDYQLSSTSISQDAETFLLNAINMNFFERLNLAWKIMFPSPTQRKSSNARIAKQRLKMILFSDRCAVSDEAKEKIVKNVVHALSEFVEIESQDKVQLSVTTDTDLGTVYSVTVPVRRVKPGYQGEEETETITNIEYKDNGETSGSVDVRFDFFIPDERTR